MKEFIHPVPTGIYLYQEGDLDGLDIQNVGRYLTEKTGIPFHIQGNIYEGLSKERLETFAEQFAKIKIKDPGKRFQFNIPLLGEIDYEKRRIQNLSWRFFGILYEGVMYQKKILELICEDKLELNQCCILFTNQLFGTWGKDDSRYHARVSLYGFPHLISITGLVEAPAKPKAYYFKKQMGLSKEWLEEEYQDRFLDHGDPRMTEVTKGYAMQALFFNLTDNPFCKDRDCRLFNSHWQEEVLHSQLDGGYEFCPKHEEILRRLRKGPP